MAVLHKHERRRFGRTGLDVSPIGFGGAPIGFLETERRAVAEVLGLLLDSGVNVIDTVAMYRGSESAIGEAVGHRRDEFVLISKCGHAVEGLPQAAWTPELILASVDRSLRNLKTDHLDVMLLHSCELSVLEEGSAIDALVRAQQQGKVRHVGYSGDNEAAAYAAARPEIEVIQTSVNICDQRNIDTVLPVTQRHDVGVMAKRPIANAAWKEPGAQEGMYRDYARVYHDRLKKMKITPAELGEGFGGEPDAVWPEVALRFTLNVEGVHTAIVGTTKPRNAERNIEIVNKGLLPGSAMGVLRAAFRSCDPMGEWVGQT